MRTLVALATALLLSACAGGDTLETLRHAPPANQPYLAALVDGYQKFAEQKALAGDWDAAERIAAKGLRAANGEAVEPEVPSEWNIAEGQLEALEEARGNLLTAAEQTRTTQPALTAAATVAYDRWVEATANSAAADIVDVRATQFAQAYEKLGQVQAAQPGIDAPVSEPAAQAGNTAATVLYFPFDKDTLGSTAKTALQALVKKIKTAKAGTITINGHADRVGTETYNLDLSQRRARFVEGALKKNGIPAGKLHYYAFGESDPAVHTADGVEEPKNRRVEIFME